MANPNIGKTQGNSNINWMKFKAGLDVKQLKTDEERSIFNMLNKNGNSVLSNDEVMGVVTGKVSVNGKLVDKQFIKVKDLSGGMSLIIGEDGKQHVLSKEGKLLSDDVGFVAEFTKERHYKTEQNTFEALAKALFKGEGIENPSKEQIAARTEQLKNLNPSLRDGQLKGQNVVVKTTPERMAELQRTNYSKYKNEASGIAKEFYNISSNNRGKTSMEKMQKLVDEKFSAENIEAILDSYDKYKQKDSSIIDTVLSEWGVALSPSGQGVRKDVLKSIMGYLADAASNAGVSKAEIEQYKNDYEKALAAIDYDPKPSPERLEKALDGLRGAISAKRSGAKSVSTKEAMSEMTSVAAQEHNTALTQFNDARAAEKNSWSAKIGDWGLRNFFDISTNADMAGKIAEYNDWVNALQNAKTEEEFKDIFQNGGFNKNGLRFSGTGIPFDENKMAARKELVNKYEYATSMNTTVAAALDCKMVQSYEELRAKIKHNFQMDDATVDNIILSYSPIIGKVSFTNEEKEQYLRKFIDDVMNNANQELNAVTGGKTVEQLGKDVELITRSAFGKQNIIQEVIQHNENERFAATVTQAGAEIAGTIALQFVPGLGQAAAGRLAASAGKFGTKAVKYAKVANKIEKAATKVEKAASAVQKVQTGAKAAKGASIATKAAAKGGQMAYQMASTGAATFAIDMSDGKSVKESLEKAMTNATFAGVGVTSNMLAPKFMQAFGISNELATQFAEEVINAIGSAGVVSLQGGEYGSTDALIDMITGLAISRFAGGAGHYAKGAVDAPTPHTKVNTDVSAPKPNVEVTTKPNVEINAKPNVDITTKPNVDAPAPKANADVTTPKPNTDVTPPKQGVDFDESSVSRQADFENGDRLVDYVKHEQNGVEYEIPYVEYADGTYGLDASKIRTADGNGGYRIATKEDLPEGILLDQQEYQWFVTNKDPMKAAGFFSDLFGSKKIDPQLKAKLKKNYMTDVIENLETHDNMVISSRLEGVMDGKSLITDLGNVTDIRASMRNIGDGNVFSVGTGRNQKLYIKNGDTPVALNISKEKFEELFPDLGVASFYQTGGNVCTIQAKINSMLDSSKGRVGLFTMFEQRGNDVVINLRGKNKAPIVFEGGKPININPLEHHYNLFGGDAPGIEMLQQAVLADRIRVTNNTPNKTNINDFSIESICNEACTMADDATAAIPLIGNRGKFSNNAPEISRKLITEEFQPGVDVMTFRDSHEVHQMSITNYDPSTGMVTFHDPKKSGVNMQEPLDAFLNRASNVYLNKGADIEITSTPAADVPMNTSTPIKPSVTETPRQRFSLGGDKPAQTPLQRTETPALSSTKSANTQNTKVQSTRVYSPNPKEVGIVNGEPVISRFVDKIDNTHTKTHTIEINGKQYSISSGSTIEISDRISLRADNDYAYIEVKSDVPQANVHVEEVKQPEVTANIKQPSIPIPSGYRANGTTMFKGKECVQIINENGRVLTEIDGRWQEII